MDMNLPDMDGDLLFRKMRRIYPDLNVILCSGYGLDDEILQLIADGARDFMQKPFGIKLLQMALAGL